MRWVFCVFRDFTDWFCEAAVRGDHGRSGVAPATVPVRLGDNAREAAFGDATCEMSQRTVRSQFIRRIRTPFSATEGDLWDAFVEAA